ncbi:hypothetical protein BDZ91DRAFT_741237 [Kalaharituber pfeilii]|nr:hypothetical protein BDZ91DRAFT_741237 [Kalaharituber pfeilii]
MWKMLSHLLEPSQGSCSLSLSDIQVHGQAFPFLKKAVIKATRYPHPMRLQVYDCDLKDFAVPFLFHSGLENLELSALDKGPLIWDEALYTIPNSETVKHLSLTNAHLPTLNSLLACTPNLSTLCYTHLRNIIFPEHRWVDYFVLGSALSHVKDTLTTLTLRTFMFGSLDLSTMILGTECGFRGDARALSLSGFTKLRDLTTNLSLLLGVNNESGMSLSQALPEGLEVLRLVDELKPLDGCWWEEEQVANIVGQYMRERGKGTLGGKGRLEKVGFVSEWQIFNDPDVPEWYCMAPSKDIERVANETGVVVQYAYTYEYKNWYFSFVEREDYDWLRQRGITGW